MSAPANLTQSLPWTITTAIFYVNAKPHIGHALEDVQTDVFARYRRLMGHDVYFQTGTDENSLKNVQAAAQMGVPTAELVAENAAMFEQLQPLLGLSTNHFIRTSVDPHHRAGVYRLWQACADAGDIYQRPYRGLYCVGCEQFLDEEELNAGRCPIHGTEPDLVEEENYFFRLSRYQDQLLHLIESDQFRIVPETRRNEVLSFIRRGLHDFSISRSQARAKGWGIPVPGDDSQVVYVWFDALANYITGLSYADDGPRYRRYWQESAARVHVIGKDITRFHAIYWPAMLLSAGLPLPTTLFVHGFITVEGRKMSKSLGNVIDPVAYVERYGRDAVRYYLLRKIPAAGDGDFSHAEFVQSYNADLADQLGNLLHRVLSMLARYYQGQVPQPGALSELDRQLVETATALPAVLDAAMADFAPHKALDAIWSLIAAANKYIVEVEPWVLAKVRGQRGPEGERAAVRLATTLYVLAEALRLIAHALLPFLPDTAAALAQQLGISLATDGVWPRALQWGNLPVGTQSGARVVLFPKLEMEEQISVVP